MLLKSESGVLLGEDSLLQKERPANLREDDDYKNVVKKNLGTIFFFYIPFCVCGNEATKRERERERERE